VLRLLEATAHSTGRDFFRDLARNLSLALGTDHVFVAELAGNTLRVRTLAFWGPQGFLTERLLGLRPEEVVHTLGLSLIAPMQETQPCVQEQIAAIRRGKERACVELELRRTHPPSH